MSERTQEILAYIFFGGLTTLVSIGSFAFFDLGLGMEPLLANLFSWILAVTFAYLTNRRWVFRSRSAGAWTIAREAASFFGGRLLTLGIEEGILFVFITLAGLDDLLIKVIAQGVVLVSNYLISKWIVFRPAGKAPADRRRR